MEAVYDISAEMTDELALYRSISRCCPHRDFLENDTHVPCGCYVGTRSSTMPAIGRLIGSSFPWTSVSVLFTCFQVVLTFFVAIMHLRTQVQRCFGVAARLALPRDGEPNFRFAPALRRPLRRPKCEPSFTLNRRVVCAYSLLSCLSTSPKGTTR